MWVSKRYLFVFWALESRRLLQERFHAICNMLFLPCQVHKPAFLFGHYSEVNPQQRCRYSNLSFARILFHTAGSRYGLEGVHTGAGRVDTHKLEETHRFLVQNLRIIEHVDPKNTEFEVCTFEMSREIMNFRRRLPAGTKSSKIQPFCFKTTLYQPPKAKNSRC